MSNESQSPTSEDPEQPRRNPYAAPDPDAPEPPPKAPAPRAPMAPEPSDPKDPREPKEPLKPPTKEELQALSKGTLGFGLAMVATMLGSQLPLPYAVIAPVLGVATIVLGVRAIIRSRKIMKRNLLTPMVAMGIALALALTATSGARLAFWPVEMERQECLAVAITNTAEDECFSEYNTGVQDFLETLR